MLIYRNSALISICLECKALYMYKNLFSFTFCGLVLELLSGDTTRRDQYTFYVIRYIGSLWCVNVYGHSVNLCVLNNNNGNEFDRVYKHSFQLYCFVMSILIKDIISGTHPCFAVNGNLTIIHVLMKKK